MVLTEQLQALVLWFLQPVVAVVVVATTWLDLPERVAVAAGRIHPNFYRAAVGVALVVLVFQVAPPVALGVGVELLAAQARHQVHLLRLTAATAVSELTAFAVAAEAVAIQAPVDWALPAAAMDVRALPRPPLAGPILAAVVVAAGQAPPPARLAAPAL